MCGLFGVVYNVDHDLMISLAIANRDRGTDSLSYFHSNGRYRAVGDPVMFAGRYRPANCWFLAGHTRFATRGAINIRNAHAFRMGTLVGSHNGCVSAPLHYRVDSLYVFHMLALHGLECLQYVQGSLGLSWYQQGVFFLYARNQTLSVARNGNGWVYSSSAYHLAQCGFKKSYRLADGELWTFDQQGTVQKRILDEPAIRYRQKKLPRLGASHDFRRQDDWRMPRFDSRTCW